jgi:hypothetical protein
MPVHAFTRGGAVARRFTGDVTDDSTQILLFVKKANGQLTASLARPRGPSASPVFLWFSMPAEPLRHIIGLPGHLRAFFKG